MRFRWIALLVSTICITDHDRQRIDYDIVDSLSYLAVESGDSPRSCNKYRCIHQNFSFLKMNSGRSLMMPMMYCQKKGT